MNARKSKMLRRVARLNTVSLPNVSYEKGSPPVFSNQLPFALGKWVKIQKGVPTVLGECTRKLYKQLKKA